MVDDKSMNQKDPDDCPHTMRSFLIHGLSRTSRWDFRHHIVPPISASTAYRLEKARRAAYGFESYTEPLHHRHRYHPVYIYERLDEPVRAILEEQLAVMEKASYSLTFSTGMAAISSLMMCLLQQGDEILAHHTLYGCTHSLFTNWLVRYGITIKFSDFNDIQQLYSSITDKTRVVYFETPTNPILDIIDIKSVVDAVKKANRHRDREIFTVVDNTFATAYCQRPLELGVDFVVESLTKNTGGFGTDMGGMVATSRKELEGDLFLCRKDFGGVLNSRSAWSILVYGIPTLPVRIDRQIETASRVVEYLKSRDEVDYVRWPGDTEHPHYTIAKKQMRSYEGEFSPSTLIFFSLKGSPVRARGLAERLIDTLAKHAYTITLAVSLGQIRTLIEHPASMTHASIPPEEQLLAGINPGGLRLSIGLESPEDIIRDLDTAFSSIHRNKRKRRETNKPRSTSLQPG